MSHESENNYVLRRWHELSDEAKRMLAASLQERTFLVLIWRLEYRYYISGCSSDDALIDSDFAEELMP